MVPTLAPHAVPHNRESHVPKEIPRVLPFPKIQDRDARRVCERGAFTAMAVASVGINVIVFLRAATACAASATTSTAATSTVSCNLCRHRGLNSCGLRSTRVWDTGRRMPHVTLLDEGSEGGVQALWAVVGKEPELIKEIIEGDRGERALLG